MVPLHMVCMHAAYHVVCSTLREEVLCILLLLVAAHDVLLLTAELLVVESKHTVSTSRGSVLMY